MPRTVQSHDLEVYADYSQFYLQDSRANVDTSEIWDGTALDRHCALRPDFVAVGTVIYGTVPVRIDLLDGAPGDLETETDHAIEATLTPDGDETILVWEERGMALDLVAAYGAGVQVHVEDLAAYLAGRQRCDANARFEELFPAYQELAANLS